MRKEWKNIISRSCTSPVVILDEKRAMRDQTSCHDFFQVTENLLDARLSQSRKSPLMKMQMISPESSDPRGRLAARTPAQFHLIENSNSWMNARMALTMNWSGPRMVLIARSRSPNFLPRSNPAAICRDLARKKILRVVPATSNRNSERERITLTSTAKRVAGVLGAASDLLEPGSSSPAWSWSAGPL